MRFLLVSVLGLSLVGCRTGDNIATSKDIVGKSYPSVLAKVEKIPFDKSYVKQVQAKGLTFSDWNDLRINDADEDNPNAPRRVVKNWTINPPSGFPNLKDNLDMFVDMNAVKKSSGLIDIDGEVFISTSAIDSRTRYNIGKIKMKFNEGTMSIAEGGVIEFCTSYYENICNIVLDHKGHMTSIDFTIDH